MEIKDIKESLTLAEVIKHYGFKADKYNRINCPFHNDKTPSMQLYYKTHTAYCFSANCSTHGKSLDVIDFIMNMEKSNKHEAIKKAESLIVEAPNNKNKIPNQKSMQELISPGQAILTNMFIYFKNAVHNSKPAQEYIKSRNLDATRIEIGYNTAQFHHGNRKEEALIQSCVQVGLLTPWGTSKTGEQAYKAFAKYCICFAMRDRGNHITGLYFRSTINNDESKHYYLKESIGLYPKYPNAETEKLIIAESIIDTASLQQIESINKDYTLLSAYGTNRLNDEMKLAINELKQLKEIIFAFDNDQAGNKAVEKYAKELLIMNDKLLITKIELPCKDVNETLQAHSEDIFLHLLENRVFIFSNEKENPKEKEIVHPKSESLNTSNPFKIIYTTETAIYYIQGGVRSETESMKVTLVIENSNTGKKSRNKVDLYEDKQVEKTAREASEKLQLRSDLLESDINELTDHLDHYRELRIMNGEAGIEQTVYPLTALEHKQAEEFLKSSDLLNKINQLIGKSGVTGEEASRLFLFIIASSYKMPDTLHALVQGSTGSGKTHLIVKISELMPVEDVRFLTRVTESSFFNYGEYELKNKLFCMEDLDGLKEEAFLAFRELQSRGQLASSTSEKDEKGNIKARIRIVKGPIGSLSATTKGAIYEDNMSRCFLISVDESSEQTKSIIEYQNRRAAGGINKEEEKQNRNLLRNCIRILQPLEVINPYAGQITLPEEAHKIRRLNDLYQSFVRQVTLLNQYKRKKDDKGRLIAEKEDLEQASEIMFDSIMLKVDELDGSLRQFYERLKIYVESKGKEYKNYAFGRKEIRDVLRISKSQQHRFLNDLYEMEYISQQGGSSHSGYKYKIQVWDDMQALRARIKRYLQGQLNQLDLFDGVPARSKNFGTPNEKKINKLSNGVPNKLEHQSERISER